MTDPTRALADAARKAHQHWYKRLAHWLTAEEFADYKALTDALAAYDAAQDRRRLVEAIADRNDALLQAAKAVVESYIEDENSVDDRALMELAVEVDIASKGGAA